MQDTLEALPPLDTLPPLEGLPPLDERAAMDGLPPLETMADTSLLTDETFDALLASAAAAEPDSTEAAETLAALVREVMDSGEVDRALEMAMTLGATACMHPHLEDLANELGEEVFGRVQGQGDHGHDHHEANAHDDKKKDKRRQRASISLADLLANRLFSKASGQN